MRNSKRCLSLALVCSVTVNVSCSRSVPNWSSNDATVYAIAFNAMFSTNVALDDHTIVLVDSSDTYPQARVNDDDSVMGELLKTRRDAFENMQQRSMVKHWLRPLTSSLDTLLAMRVVLADNQQFVRVQALSDSLARANVGPQSGLRMDRYWRGFYAMYPGSVGAVSVSSIGYSRDGNFAIFYLQQGCGDLCGEGNFLLLHRDAGVWHFGRKIRTSVS